MEALLKRGIAMLVMVIGLAFGESETYAQDVRAWQTAREILRGTWRGSYHCAQGDSGVELSFSELHDDGFIRGTFRFFDLPGKNNTAGGGRFVIGGNYNIADGTLLLSPGAWLHRPPGDWDSVAFSVRLTPDGRTLEGKIHNLTCTEISVSKASNEPSSAVDLDQESGSSRTGPNDPLAARRRAFARTMMWHNLFIGQPSLGQFGR
jgi:hypothetical protein